MFHRRRITLQEEQRRRATVATHALEEEEEEEAHDDEGRDVVAASSSSTTNYLLERIESLEARLASRDAEMAKEMTRLRARVDGDNGVGGGGERDDATERLPLLLSSAAANAKDGAEERGEDGNHNVPPGEDVVDDAHKDEGDDQGGILDEERGVEAAGGVAVAEGVETEGSSEEDSDSFKDKISAGGGQRPFRGSLPTLAQTETGATDRPKSAFIVKDLETDDFRNLPMDVYTFFMTEYWWPVPMQVLLAVVVVVFQVLFFVIILVDLKSGPSGNPFNFPADVSPTVRMVQCLCLLMAVPLSYSIRTSIQILSRRYAYYEFEKVFPACNVYKYVFSNATRIGVSLIQIVDVFVYVMTGDTASEILLSFAALEFMGYLDEIFFMLCIEGYGTQIAKDAAGKIRDTFFHFTRKSRRYVLFILTALLLTFWAWIFARQEQGYYLPDTVAVQFGDEFDSRLGAFSGLYDKTDERFGGRNVYVERRSGGGGSSAGSSAIIAYCSQEKAWAFTVRMDGPCDSSGDSNGEPLDPCDWLALSSETDLFDVSATFAEAWYTRNEGRAKVEIDEFYGECYGNCFSESPHDICGGGDGGKGGRGFWNKEERRCECNEGYYGFRCDLEEPCPLLMIDARNDGFIGTREFAQEYETLSLDDGSLAQVYDKPVYVSTQERKADGGLDSDIILFTGRRWIMASRASFEEASGSSDSDLARYLKHNFHAHCSSYTAIFVSEAIDVGTPNDSSTPVGLKWYAASDADLGPFGRGVPAIDSAQPAQAANLLCQVCDEEENPCFYDGVCAADKHCACSEGVEGVLCQVSPDGNGLCNPFFNGPEFRFDGGDCCETTCMSREQYSCGRDATGMLLVGYDRCRDPQQISEDNWISAGDELFGDSNSANMGASVALSALGAVMVVGEPGIESVRIFDRDASSWRFRDSLPALPGGDGGMIGTHVAVAAPAKAWPSPSKKVPIVVAVAGLNSFQVFQWLDDLDAWEDARPNVELHPEQTPMVRIFDEGRILAVFEQAQGVLHLWRRPSWTDDWAQLADISGILAFSISDDASRLAVALSTEKAVTVYEFDGSEYEAHSQVDIPGNSLSIHLASSGKVLGVLGYKDGTSEGEVWIFDENQDNEDGSDETLEDGNNSLEWIQRRLGIRGLQIDTAPTKDSVVLSENGHAVTIVSKIAYSVRSFLWRESKWHEMGKFDGSSASMTPGGTTIAVGSPEDDTTGANRGKISVYERVFPMCGDGESRLRLSLTLDDAPMETLWQVYDAVSSKVVRSGGPYSPEHAGVTVVEEVCVSSSSCLDLYMLDTKGNGLRSPGLYGLMVDGEPVLTRSGQFGSINGGSIGPGQNCTETSVLPAFLETPLNERCRDECQWRQVGADINGEAENARMGADTSLSADGNVVATSAIKGLIDDSSGSVIVLANNEGKWTPRGQKIVGEENDDYLGLSLSLSGRGEMLAVGIPGPAFHPSLKTGRVRIYSYARETDRWNLNIELTDEKGRFGRSVVLSEDGKVVAIGASLYVRVFALNADENAWVQRGQDIEGEDDSWGAVAGREGSVSLSAAGDIIAVGSQEFYEVQNVYQLQHGLVRIFEYNAEKDQWTQLGGDIRPLYSSQFGGPDKNEQQGVPTHGSLISLSRCTSKGNCVVAISGSTSEIYGEGFALIMTYNATSEDWEQLGQYIVADQGGFAGQGGFVYAGYAPTVSLSGDGRMLALGESHSHKAGVERAGQVRVFQYVPQITEWRLVGMGLSGDEEQDYFGQKVSLSSDGLTVAASTRRSDGNNAGESAGILRVFELFSVHDQSNINSTDEAVCSDGLPFRLELNLDMFPQDISWKIVNGWTTPLIEKSYEKDVDEMKSEVVNECIPSNENGVVVFSIEDDFGDGISGSWGDGGYKVFWNGEEISDGEGFESVETICLAFDDRQVKSVDVTFAQDRAAAGCTDTFTQLEDVSRNMLLFRKGYSTGGSEDGRYMSCEKADSCLALTLNHDASIDCSVEMKYDISYDNSEVVSDLVATNLDVAWLGDCSCPSGMTPFQLSFKTKGTGGRPEGPYVSYDNHAFWTLKDGSNEELLRANYSEPLDVMNYWICTQTDDCLTFNVGFDVVGRPASPWEGSYLIWYDGVLRFNSFEHILDGRLHQVGNCATRECSAGTHLFRLDLTTESHPLSLDGSSDTLFWSVLDSSNNVRLQTGYDVSDADKSFAYGECLPVTGCHTFIIDGLRQEENSYVASWDGKTVKAQSNGFGSSDLVQFGSCPESQCAAGYSLLQVVVKTDDFPRETSWTVTDDSGETLLQADNYTLPRRHFHHEACIPTSECFSFSFMHNEDGSRGWYDTWRSELKGSYSLFLDGDLKTTVKGLGGPREHHFGQCAEEQCPILSSLVRLDIETSSKPGTLSWNFLDAFENVLLQSSYHASDSNKMHQHRLCLPFGSCARFVIENTPEDEQDVGANFNISIGGEVVQGSGGLSGKREEFLIGDCYKLSCFPPPSPAPSISSAISNVTASSSNSEARNVVDGNPYTEWKSKWIDKAEWNPDGENDAWIELEFNSTYEFRSVTLQWGGALAQVYKIQVSCDGNNWTTVHTETHGDSNSRSPGEFTDEILLHPGIAGRYLRVLCTRYGYILATSLFYSLEEIEVRGFYQQTDIAIQQPATLSQSSYPSSPTSSSPSTWIAPSGSPTVAQEPLTRELAQISGSNASSTALFQLRFRLPSEAQNSWSLINSRNDILLEGSYRFWYATRYFEHESCVPRDECLLFVMEDSGGNGFAVSPIYEIGGRFSVLYDGEVKYNMRKGDNWGKEFSVLVGNCPDPILQSIFSVVVQLDSYPSETGWKITSEDESKTYVEYAAGHYTEASIEIRETVHLERGLTYKFIISDSYGDGIQGGSYELYLGLVKEHGDLIFSGSGDNIEPKASHVFSVP